MINVGILRTPLLNMHKKGIILMRLKLKVDRFVRCSTSRVTFFRKVFRQYIKQKQFPMRCSLFISILSFSIVNLTFAGITSSSSAPACPVMSFKDIVLIGLGDSMTQGTMNATNNATNTQNAYLQKVYESLDQVAEVSFSQPFFDNQPVDTALIEIWHIVP